jgi:para-nitrobenzyl esterase
MLTRRKFLLHTAFAAAGARAAVGQQPSTPSTTLQVAQGQLRGEFVDNVQVFRGVPFAKPPINDLRFRAPQEPVAWSGIRDCTHFAAASVQPSEDFKQSEDCLYLNLWAPRERGLYPVFVWIHGGGFTSGRSFEPIFDGTHFAQAGIVCITVAYRLGALGFLDVSSLLGDAYAGSANNGLRDLVAALEWVQQNVSSFGGDRRRVTIGGESAGAKLTDMLMGIPSAQPLFHQIISESGGAERIWSADRAAPVARGFGAAWTRRTSLPLANLLTAPARQIVNVQQKFTRDWPIHFPFRAERCDLRSPSAAHCDTRRVDSFKTSAAWHQSR